MKSWAPSAALATLLVAVVAPNLTDRAQAEDLRDAVPTDMFLAAYGRHNPERDYQKQYYEDVWKAVEDSRIIERVMQIIQANMSDDDVGEMLAFRDTIKAALEPVEWDKLKDCTEVVYAQKLQGPFTHNILMMRFSDTGAESLVEGIGNLFAMADEAAGDAIQINEQTHGKARLVTLQLPPQVPISPTIGVRGDLFIYSSGPDLAAQCLTLLENPDAESKFDDARVKAALEKLPEAEDALVFFDGRALADQLQGVVAFIQGVGAGNEDAMRVAGFIGSIFKEVDAFDHEVTVEYTDGYRNRTATYGKFKSGFESTVVGKMVVGQKPFSDWSKWVPANASGFSMNSGANLHPIYEWITTKVPEIFPESQEGFDKLAEIQDSIDFSFDEDLLQGFSGETVSITMPGPLTPFGPSAKSVSFMRCNKPDRIRELIHRAFAALEEVPQVQQQGISLTESDIEGFDRINANFFALMGGLSPVVGFRDGWMTAASHSDAVHTIDLVRSGEAESFASTDRFKQFGLDVSGDVYSISYSNTGESIRQAAQGLQQFGSMLPMFIGMAGQGANDAELGPVKDLLGLLPSIGRIVAKFDFIDSKMSVTQPAGEPGAYIRHSVVMIRPPAGDAGSAN